MATDTDKVRAKLDTLIDSLDDLESQLEPLLAQTLPETIVGLDTPIQQAKLQVVLPYIVYDLVFIYLKSRGIDPKTHPVVGELDRVRQYFEKIKNAEEPPKPRTQIDQAAANRFIKHAITQVKYGRPPGDKAEPTPSEARVPPKITSKMVERAEYEKELKEMGSEEEEDLKMFDGDDEDGDEEDEEDNQGVRSDKGKGKQKASETMDDGYQVGKKRRRLKMDPFADYGGADQESTPQPTKKSKNKNRDLDLLQDNSGRSTPTSSASTLSKKEAKAAKKAKRKAERLEAEVA